MKKLLWMVPLVAASALVAAPAQARKARCTITGPNGTIYAGPCNFAGERGGSFTVGRPNGRPFAGDIVAFRVTVDGEEGEIRSVTARGGGTFYGAATRSDADRACWEGGGLSVCAY